MKAMSTLFQLYGMEIFSALIARMAPHANRELAQVHQLLYNLFMFGYIPEQTRLKVIPNRDKIKDTPERGIIAIEITSNEVNVTFTQLRLPICRLVFDNLFI